MSGKLFLLLAASLPSAIWAQTTKPLPATGSAQNAQPQTQADILSNDPGFRRLAPDAQAWVSDIAARLHTAIEQKDIRALEQLKLEAAQRELAGTKFCGEHIVNDGTFVDAFVRNQSYEAFAVRWLDRDPAGAVHTAIFTGSGRCVVSNGDTLKDGKLISRLMPNSLAVSAQHGLVAYEAEYWNDPFEAYGDRAAHRGVFIDNQFLVELDVVKASRPFTLNLSDQERDFWWNDKAERLEMRPGVVLALVPPAQKPFPPRPAPGSTQPHQSLSACGDAKPPAKKPSLGGIPLPDSVAKILEKAANPCLMAPSAGQGAKQ